MIIRSLPFPTLAFGLRAVELGCDMKIQKGEMSVEVTNGKGEDEDNKVNGE